MFRPLKAIIIAGLFVILGTHLYNIDKEFTAAKIVGLANILFFGSLIVFALYSTVKNTFAKK